MLSRAHSPLGPLPEGWCVKYLSEVSSKIGSGSTPRGGESAYISRRENFAFVRSQQVYDFYFEKNDLRFITDSDAEKLKGVHLKENDLLLNITGDGVTFSRCCIVPKEILPAAVNQHVSVIRLDQEKCLSGYLLSYLCHPKIKEYVASFNAGGSRRAITKQHIESFEIPLPPLYVQEAIQKVVFGLLNKIQLNHQINQTLEQMAQALFKSWFVDFEPVKAKIAARRRWQALQPNNELASPVCYAAELDEPPAVGDLETTMNRAAMQAISGKTVDQLDALREEDPERYQELYETAALFPSAMQPSELGEIPEGWKVTPFDKLARLDSSSIKPSDNPEKMWEHYSIPAFDAGKAPALDAGISIKSGKYKVKKTSVLISKLNPGTSRVWWPEPLDNESAICSTEFMQFVPESEELRAFIAGVISSSPFQAGVIASVTGSTGSRQRAQPKQVARMDVVAPCEALALRYARQARPLFTAQAKNISQSQKLAELRDTLLLKLLSGELTPSEVEETQAEVTA